MAGTPVIDPRMPTRAIPIARCRAVRRRPSARPYRPSIRITMPNAAGMSAVGLTMWLSRYPPTPTITRRMPMVRLSAIIGIRSEFAGALQGAREARQILAARNGHGAETLEMRRQPLHVEELEAVTVEAIDQHRQRNLGRVGHAVKHRFAEE